MAAVICGGSGGAIEAQTTLTTINTKGDFKIHTNVILPKPCKAPVVIIREHFDGNIGGWLAPQGSERSLALTHRMRLSAHPMLELARL